MDSTKDDTVEVPNTAPITVPTESASSARSTFSNSPCSFTSPLRLATATSVPAVSKKSTNRNEKRIKIVDAGLCNNSWNPFVKAPNVSIWKFVVIKEEGKLGIPSIPIEPHIIPTPAVIIIPIKTAAGTFLTTMPSVIKIPKTANKTVGSCKSPRPTKVDGLEIIIPAFFKPTNAIKKPIPAPIANFSCLGIALMTALRIPVIEIRRNTIPERKTALNAAYHEYPIPKQTV